MRLLSHLLLHLYNQIGHLRCRRDAALLLIGFWRGFRSDELCRLQVEHIQAQAGAGMTLFLPWSESDRDNHGTTHYAPALKRLYPVQAYLDWISAAGLVRGAVFRRLARSGHLNDDALNPGSLIRLLHRALQRSGLTAEADTSHSLRRGCATWATARLGQQDTDDIRGLEGHQVSHVLHRPGDLLRRPRGALRAGFNASARSTSTHREVTAQSKPVSSAKHSCRTSEQCPARASDSSRCPSHASAPRKGPSSLGTKTR
ncbi:tyrosine-type recombinase/integrase [Pseudomonas delhiensis]|uniref:tyrosine-type recombinase/integrase n=1 Tax=Pseudomonas delhiensis TaxID=366289 RepID=UPI003CC5DCF2